MLRLALLGCALFCAVLGVPAFGAEPAKAETGHPANASVKPMPQAARKLALGRKYLEENRLRVAAQNLAEAVRDFEKQQAPSPEQFEAYLLYGRVLGLIGEHNQALNYHFKAQKVTLLLKSQPLQAEALASIGSDLMALKDYAQAELYLKKGADLFLAEGSKAEAAQCLANVGDCFQAKAQPKRAADNYSRALGLFEESEDLPGQVRVHERRARALTEMRAFTEAINELQVTLRLADSAKMVDEKTAAYLDLADCYADAGEETKSVFYGNIGLNLAQRYKALSLQERGHLLLSNAYSQQNKNDKALRHYKSYIGLRDRIANDARNRQLTEMRLQYDNERIGKKIAVLTREKRIQELDLARKENLIWTSIGVIALLGVVALLLQRKNLIERNANAKLHATNLQIEQQRDQIEVQKVGLTQALDQLESSIQYAKRIQDAILSASDPLSPQFSDPLIYFRPKAIVSGDFYWVSHHGDETVLVVADCTGHGVPGAFMSLVGHATLVRAVGAVPDLDPARLLSFVDDEIGRTLGNQPDLDIKEGIEMSVCVLNRSTRMLRFAGARRDAILVCDHQVETLHGSRRSVGGVYARQAPAEWQYKTQALQLPPNCSLYLFSDGFTDQHGAEGKKFGLPRMRTLLKDIFQKSSKVQEARLDKELAEWSGSTDQTDDILIVGLRLS